MTPRTGAEDSGRRLSLGRWLSSSIGMALKFAVADDAHISAADGMLVCQG